MANSTFAQVQQRANDLIGETSTSTASAVLQRHINSVIQDILGDYKFSWNLESGSITLSGGTAALPTDYYPGWGIDDARIIGTGNPDQVFQCINVADRDSYDTSTPVYWITYSGPITDSYIFNSNIQTGTVTIFYHYNVADMVNPTDICVVIDPELVAYGAAAKNWISDERNTQLQQLYEQKYEQGIKALFIADLMNGPDYTLDGLGSSQVNWVQ